VRRNAGDVSGATGAPSAVADFMPAGTARFPRLRKASRKAQKGIRNCGFRPAVFRTPSAVADLPPRTLKRRPQLRILCLGCQKRNPQLRILISRYQK
jgi:hypothetical protein